MGETVTQPTVEQLLKQVYAAHKQTIREFEDKLQAQRSNSDDCKQCNELKTALTECREKYFDVLQQQKQQIELLEKRLANVQLIENFKNKRSVGTQSSKEDHAKDILIDVIDRNSTSNSSASRKRHLQSTTPPSARKKGCVIEETLSEASSTLLKNNESPVAVKNDLFLIDTTHNSLEQEPGLVLVPNSPENNNGMDRFEEMRILSCHRKVSKWLSEVEIPETVPVDNISILLNDTEHVGTISLPSIDSKDQILPVLSSNHVAEIGKENVTEIQIDNSTTRDLSSRQEPLTNNKCFGIKQFIKNECQTAKSLCDSAENVSTLETDSPRREIGKSSKFPSEKKPQTTWCTKKKVPRQSKLKLYFGQKSKDKDVPANIKNVLLESQDLDATVLPTDKTKTGPGSVVPVPANNPRSKRDVAKSSPDNKENMNGACSGSEASSEDLLANKNVVLYNVSPETKNNAMPVPALQPKHNNSFDEIPTKSDKLPFKVKEQPVRGRAARDQLPGHECDYCLQYYDNLGLSEGEKKARLKMCSKHRANNTLPNTPEHYWEIGFPDTPECQERGYVNVTQKVQLRPRRRRPLK